MRKPSPSGMSVLVAWAVHDCRKAFGAELDKAGFTLLLLRKICHASIVAGPIFVSRQHDIGEGWAVHPDLTLRIMTTTRASVPLPCSKSKQARLSCFLLWNRVLRMVKQDAFTREIRWTTIPTETSIDKELADAATEFLGKPITAGEICKCRKRLTAALRKRKLLGQAV